MSTMPSLIERKRQEVAEELVRTAIELFHRDGFEATTVESIAAAAGCSPRTFYRYFGSKEDVMFHDLPATLTRLRGALQRRLAEPVGLWTAVSAAVLDNLGRFEDSADRVAIQREELWLREPALRARLIQHVGIAEDVIVDCVCARRGTEPETDDLARLMAIAAIGAYRTTITTHGEHRNGRRLTRHLRDLLSAFGEGLAAEHTGPIKE